MLHTFSDKWDNTCQNIRRNVLYSSCEWVNVWKGSSHFSQADSTYWWWFTPLCLGEINASVRTKNEKNIYHTGKCIPSGYLHICIFFPVVMLLFLLVNIKNLSSPNIRRGDPMKGIWWFQGWLIHLFLWIYNIQTGNLVNAAMRVDSCLSSQL